MAQRHRVVVTLFDRGVAVGVFAPGLIVGDAVMFVCMNMVPVAGCCRLRKP